MVNIYDYAHNLARALKDSPEYKEFQSALARIKAKPASEKMVADFHKKQIEVQSAVLQGKEPSDEQKEALQQLYQVIQGHPDVRDYLVAEQRLGVVLNDVYKIINDAVNLDIPLGKES